MQNSYSGIIKNFHHPIYDILDHMIDRKTIIYTHYAVKAHGKVYAMDEDLDTLLRILPRVVRDRKYHIQSLNVGQQYQDDSGYTYHHGIDDGTHLNRRPQTH